MRPSIEAVKEYLLSLQDRVCSMAETLDGQAGFTEELWSYEQGGGGRTRILCDGQVFAKSGVNFSHIMGASLPESATERRPELGGRDFQALGLSTVMHAQNPYVPISHMNVRLFVCGASDDSPVWWFGGGFDLTPFYAFKEDVLHWHKTAFELCREFGDDVYVRYKDWCDRYFYLKHRQETRGVGGLFFDDLNEWGFERCFDFIRAVGDGYIAAYEPIVDRRKMTEFGTAERDWMRYRRGRYVEFNLVYDRGTLFGLQSGGRTESILMSLPPEVVWRYNYEPEPSSPEAELISQYLGARDWLGLD